MEYSINKNRISFEIDKGIFNRDILVKAAYGFIDEYYLHLSTNSNAFCVEIARKSGDTEPSVVDEFENELLSQAARLLVYKQTQRLRELLVARAMASTLITEEDMLKLKQPEKEDNEEELDRILKDWFEAEK